MTRFAITLLRLAQQLLAEHDGELAQPDRHWVQSRLDRQDWEAGDQILMRELATPDFRIVIDDAIATYRRASSSASDTDENFEIWPGADSRQAEDDEAR